MLLKMLMLVLLPTIFDMYQSMRINTSTYKVEFMCHNVHRFVTRKSISRPGGTTQGMSQGIRHQINQQIGAAVTNAAMNELSNAFSNKFK